LRCAIPSTVLEGWAPEDGIDSSFESDNEQLSLGDEAEQKPAIQKVIEYVELSSDEENEKPGTSNAEACDDHNAGN
jgi:hypothetical protein